MTRLRRTIAAAAVAASIGVGGLTGTVLGTPVAAGAAEPSLQEARPSHPMGGGHRHRHHHLATVAEALGVTETELRTALRSGRTIAEVADEEGVGVDAVVDALVAAAQAHLDERVASGALTQAEADARLAGAEERATALVNGDVPPRKGRHLRGGPGGGGPAAGNAAEA